MRSSFAEEMKRRIYIIAVLIVTGALGGGCNRQTDTSKKVSPPRQSTESSVPFAAVKEEDPKDQRIPATLNEALDLMMTGLTDEDRKFVEDAGDDYATSVHFGGGMGMRNSWGLWGDSPLSRYFARLGIYHADDKSAIINEAFSRRVRGKEIELEKLVQYYRAYWAEQDTVAPLDLACPHCSKEMVTGYMGKGGSEAHPERIYFYGNCPDGEVFRFYHKDGWQLNEINTQVQERSATGETK
jgi:hypothetical protein